MKPQIKPLAVLLLSAVSAPLAHAGTAAFVPGESRIVRVDREGLRVFDPAIGSEAKMELPAEVEAGGVAVASSSKRLFIASERKVFGWNPREQKSEEWWTAPEGTTILDIAFDEKNGRLVAVTSRDQGMPDWWVFKAGGVEGEHVFNRRGNGAVRPVFDANGTVYFPLQGDIWKGTIEANEPGPPAYYLEARRIWPVALRETSEGTPGGSGACEIVPLSRHLVLELSRYGGSGWGSIIRLPNEDAYKKQLALKWQPLQDCGLGSCSALSPDGKQAAVYLNHQKKWFRIDVESGDLGPFPK